MTESTSLEGTGTSSINRSYTTPLYNKNTSFLSRLIVGFDGSSFATVTTSKQAHTGAQSINQSCLSNSGTASDKLLETFQAFRCHCFVGVRHLWVVAVKRRKDRFGKIFPRVPESRHVAGSDA
mmetsp:Transcript_13949/g.32532  ORF Transcript_13949/g.32532 Transcript_13949/m.32532 type:complete len:123 (+) Transcript_13949:65-433(+)